jgi:hypothetical protein
VASIGDITTKINALPIALRKPMLDIFTELLTQLRFGHPNGSAKDPTLNFGGAFLHGTTPTTPGDELAMAHGFGRVPYLAHGVLRLDAVGSTLVPLTVSRVSDDKRIYVTSTESAKAFSLYVEG